MNLILQIAALISFVNLLHFAGKVQNGKIEAANTATWLMWFIIDAVILGSTISAGKPYLLPLSYTVGSLAVLGAHIKYGKWQWGRRETFSALGATIATVIWQTINPDTGVIAGVTALTLAGMPFLLDIKKKPDGGCFSMFALTSVACALTLLGSWPWTLSGTILAWGGLIFNTYLALVCLLPFLGVNESYGPDGDHDY